MRTIKKYGIGAPKANIVDILIDDSNVPEPHVESGPPGTVTMPPIESIPPIVPPVLQPVLPPVVVPVSPTIYSGPIKLNTAPPTEESLIPPTGLTNTNTLIPLPPPPTPTPTPTPEKNNTMLYIGIAATIAFLFLSKK